MNLKIGQEVWVLFRIQFGEKGSPEDYTEARKLQVVSFDEETVCLIEKRWLGNAFFFVTRGMVYLTEEFAQSAIRRGMVSSEFI